MTKLRQARGWLAATFLAGTLLLVGGLLGACSTPSNSATTPVALTPIPAATATIVATPVDSPTVAPTGAPVTPTANSTEPTPLPASTITDTTVDTSSGSTDAGSISGEAPAALPDTGMAVVEKVDVRILESFPVQVQAVVSGYLPDGCTTITGAEALQEGTQFRIHISTARPADAMCTEVIVKFEQVVPLQTATLPAGSYQVVVNDLAVDFELPAGVSGAQPSTQPGSYPVVATETAFVLAQVDVPMYAAPTADGNAIGLIAGGQIAKVTGASPDGAWWRVVCPDDSVGDCWVSADPAMTTPTASAAGATSSPTSYLNVAG
jgi:hypothetical protein